MYRKQCFVIFISLTQIFLFLQAFSFHLHHTFVSVKNYSKETKGKRNGRKFFAVKKIEIFIKKMKKKIFLQVKILFCLYWLGVEIFKKIIFLIACKYFWENFFKFEEKFSISKLFELRIDIKLLGVCVNFKSFFNGLKIVCKYPWELLHNRWQTKPILLLFWNLQSK